MQTQSFPSCCGIHVLAKFGHDKVSGHGSHPTSKEEIIQYINEHRKGGYLQFIQMIVLNNSQLESIGEKLFLELGFTITPLGLYNGHGSNLFMLHYNPNEDGNKLK